MSFSADEVIDMDKEFEKFKAEYLENGTPSKNAQKIVAKRARDESITCDCCPNPNLVQIYLTPKKITLLPSKFDTIRKVSLFSLYSTIFL